MPYQFTGAPFNRKTPSQGHFEQELLSDDYGGEVCLEKVGISLKVLKYPTEFLKKINEIFASVSEKFQESVIDVYIVWQHCEVFIPSPFR